MALGELDAIAVFGGVFVQNQVFAEGDVAVLLDLFVPGQPVAMGADGGDDVVQAVAIDIIDDHLGAAVAKVEGVLDPDRVALEGCGLLPPAVLFEDIDAAIAVDIAAAQAVRVTLVAAFGCNRMKFPGRRRVLPVRLGVADVSLGAAEDFGLAVAGDVHETGRLVIQFIEDDMPLPMALAALGVFVPRDFLARVPIDEHVGPAVSIDIVGESQEAVGVGVVGAQGAFEAGDGLGGAVRAGAFEAGIGGPDLVPLLEIRPFIPEGAGNHVHISVVVEVGKSRPLGPELVGEAHFLEGVDEVLRLSRRGQAGQDRRSK